GHPIYPGRDRGPSRLRRPPATRVAHRPGGRVCRDARPGARGRGSAFRLPVAGRGAGAPRPRFRPRLEAAVIRTALSVALGIIAALAVGRACASDREAGRLRAEAARLRAEAAQERIRAAGYQTVLARVEDDLRAALEERDHRSEERRVGKAGGE